MKYPNEQVTEIIEKLLAAESGYESFIGASNPGVGVEFRGQDVFKTFKDWNWLSMFYFSVSGKQLSKSAEVFLNGMYSMCFSYPDVRIWNNGVAALAATTRSTAQLGVSAAVAISEARFYGGRPMMKAVDFLLRAKESLDDGCTLDEVIAVEVEARQVLYGYGRPIVASDERVPPTIALLKEYNLLDRTYVQLALKIDEHLKENGNKFRLNVCGLFSAFCADEGISPNDAYYILVACYSVGMVACYVDVLEKPEGRFLPFRCKSIKYQGKAFRKW